MVRKTKEDAEKTYYALLNSAEQLFSIKGVAKTTLGDIAKHAGMTRGAVYWHFKNKDSIVEALWQEYMSAHFSNIISALSSLPSEEPASQFRRILQTGMDEIFSSPTMSTALRIVLHSVEITEEQTPLRSFLESKSRLLHSGITDGINQLSNASALKVKIPADVIAAGLIAYLHGLLQYHLSKEIDVDIDANRIALIDMYLGSFLEF